MQIFFCAANRHAPSGCSITSDVIRRSSGGNRSCWRLFDRVLEAADWTLVDVW